MEIIKKLHKPTPTVVFDTYWKFASERQNIFFNKINGKDVLTKDPILLKHKFTNVYRATDRVSQYLIKDVIYNKNYSLHDLLFRIILFKIFNKISTWQLFESEFGEITIEKFNFKSFSELLLEAKNAGESIYSGAYIMTSGSSIYGYKYKHENHLKLIDREIINSNLIDVLINSGSLKEVYEELLKLPTVGKFLAFQYAIDLNYSPIINFSEMDFVKAGPGALDGIRKCFSNFGDYSPEDIIKYMAEKQDYFFEKNQLEFKKIGNRSLQLIDCQNIFCEVDKYSRVAHPEINGVSNRKRIKQVYKENKNTIDLFFPPKWNIVKY
ncbi:hypothetical protein HX001_07235 [Empedobacter brevis]|uniref:5-hmdU DNA kinase helical domain-containing protein n=1 Tax=Empedobacter brevis TaxID=247 RepID=A0AAJ1QDY3_9FLAO|nr:nucleotide kinase domain-containing protein [Empedobacter brevis]MDM1072285.1 hypothetical protein [Empedobacter brevis]